MKFLKEEPEECQKMTCWKMNKKVLKFLQILICKEVWKYIEDLNSPTQVWEKLEILSSEYKCSLMLVREILYI